MYEYKEGEILYIKYMKFADDNSVDYRVNGRPYLVYRVEEDKIYLFKVGSHMFEPKYFFSKVNIIRKDKKVTRESYVDMRYYFVVDPELLSVEIDSMFNELRPHYKKSKHSSKISDKELEEIRNQVNILENMKEIKYAKLDNKFAYSKKLKS